MLNKLKKSNRYQYTCPDVIHYRKNQYRMGYVSYALSCLPVLFMWAALASFTDRTETDSTTEPTETTTSDN